MVTAVPGSVSVVVVEFTTVVIVALVGYVITATGSSVNAMENIIASISRVVKAPTPYASGPQNPKNFLSNHRKVHIDAIISADAVNIAR